MQHYSNPDFARVASVVQTGAGDSVKIRGTGTTSVLIDSTSWNGTAVLEGAVAGHQANAVWDTIAVVPAGSSQVAHALPPQYTHMRLNCSAYTAGDAKVHVVHEQD